MSRSTTRRDDVSVTHGKDADTPQEIPAKGWLQVTKRAWAEAKTDLVPLLAAGVAFKAFLAIFPALTAAFLLWGLVSTPEKITEQINGIAAIPAEARELVLAQVEAVAANQQAAGISLVIAVVLALWSASSGVQNLMSATNAAYDEEETRGFVKVKGTALVLTVGAIVFMLLAIGLIAVAPVLVNALGASSIVSLVVTVLRWVLLVVLVVLALAVVYRVAPDRDAPKVRWVSVGAAVATVLWLIASAGFSLYVSVAGGSSYTKSYGASAGVVILLMWLWITSYAILLGAEVNAESEKQTQQDTTKGPEKPLGQRDAVAADRVAPEDAR